MNSSIKNKQMSNSKTSKKKIFDKCSSCRKPKPVGCMTKTCDACKQRSITNRIKAKKNKIICLGKKKDGSKCTNGVSKKCGNKYCAKHFNEWQLYGKENKFKLCKSHTNCHPNDPDNNTKALIPIDSDYKYCENCRIKRSNYEKNLRQLKLEENNTLQKENMELRICPECPINIKYTIEQMGLKKDGTRSNLCQRHFEQMQKNENNRKPRIRDYKEYEKKPERKEYKKKYREENPDKYYKYYTVWRAKKLKENTEEYHKIRAENMKKWREKNPDKIKLLTENKKKDPRILYNFSYKLRAEKNGYDLEVEFDDFKEIINRKCYYCNRKNENYPNGIDRLDNSMGYIKDNIVACCKTCNMMKNTLNENTFILMCAHITHYNKILNFRLFPYIFSNCYNSTYLQYKYRAKKKNIDFKISKSLYDKIIYEPCYICGKLSDNNHTNGIDRYDNSKGYTIENCKTCCANCNYMKKDMNHDDFLFQCGFVALNHKDRLNIVEETWIYSGFITLNKNKKRLTNEEKIEIKKQKAQIRFEKTMSTKTDEAIQKRMQELREEKLKKVNNTI